MEQPVGFTLGTVLFGMVFLVWEIAVWWPGVDRFRGKKAMKNTTESLGELVPFILAWCVGDLLALCVGGLAGAFSDVVIWGAGWIGDAAYVWGVGGTRQPAPMAGEVPLTAGGLFMTVLVLVVFIARRSKGETASKWRGLLSGTTMGLSAGVARFAAAPIASGVNLTGAWLTGMIT